MRIFFSKPAGAMFSCKVLYILPLVCLFFISCEDTTEAPPDPGTGYFKIEKGQKTVFRMDSVWYDAFTGKADSLTKYIREFVSGSAIDSFGNRVYTIDRYVSPDTAGPWKYLDYYFCRVETAGVFYIRGNITYADLMFPVVKNKKWNLNGYNSREPAYAYYSRVGFVTEYSPDCIEVIAKNEVNFIEDMRDIRIYAKGMGLVSSVVSQVNHSGSKYTGFRTRSNRIK